MKKLIAAFAIGMAFAVHADYIYWMVEDNPVNITPITGGEAVSTSWTDAYLSLDGNQIGSLTASQWEGLKDIDAYAYSDSFSTYNPSTSTFMIELYNGDKWLGKTTASASALAAYIFSDNSMDAMPANAFGTNGATFAVPEPTSGLLFLLGGMLLGLKRRRMA